MQIFLPHEKSPLNGTFIFKCALGIGHRIEQKKVLFGIEKRSYKHMLPFFAFRLLF